MESRENGVEAKKSVTAGPLGFPDHALRLVAVALTLAAVVLMCMANETSTVQVKLLPTFPAVPVTAVAKWTYSSAFVYFLVVNAAACAYGAVSAILSVRNRGSGSTKLVLYLTMVDLMVVCLLFSGNGAASAIGVVGERGNSHVGWNKICGVFHKFCSFLKASVVLSLVGTAVHLLVVVLSVLNLHKRIK